ncbi:unnamed protein product [Rhodiola kirilowii]
MQEEMMSLHKNETYKLVEKPTGKRILKNKWVYKIKHEHGNSQPRYKVYKIKREHGNSQPRYKVHLVEKGFGQQERC